MKDEIVITTVVLRKPKHKPSLFYDAACLTSFGSASAYIRRAEMHGLMDLNVKELDLVRRFAVRVKNKPKIFTLELRKEAQRWIKEIDQLTESWEKKAAAS